MNVNRRKGTSINRGRVLVAGLILVAAGIVALGWRFHSRQMVDANAALGASGVMAAPAELTQKALIPASAELQKQARSLFAGLPLMFEPNQGQGNLNPADTRVKYVSRGPGYALFLGPEGATLTLAAEDRAESRNGSHRDVARRTALQMKLAGANANARLNAIDRLPGRTNYFLGNDSSKWRENVPQFARVGYEDVYPGINLVFYGNQGRLEYDFQVAPGSDPSRAELQFNGAKNVQIQGGALVIATDAGDVRLEAPVVYQEVAGRKQPVVGKFELRGRNRAGFAIGSYDRSRELVIDPILNFSTYFGGTKDEHSTHVAVDSSFNIYITGSTDSTDLPATGGVVQGTLNGAQNIYVAKITPPLGSVVAAIDYVTYLGGNGTDTPVGIAVDGAGDAFVAGTTSSTNFPTQSNRYQAGPEAGSPGPHVFVSELVGGPTPPAASQLHYSSYLSGNGTDVASGMTIDAAGDIYVTGTTTSTDTATTTDQFPASTLPQALPFQQFPRSSIQFFVTEVNTSSAGTGSIVYSTYFGGANSNTSPPVAVGGGIAVDTNNNIYFSGTTNFTYTGCSNCSTSDFPILDAYQPCLDTAPPTVVVNPPSCTPSSSQVDSDAFVAKLNPLKSQGQQLQWSTYVGGTAIDSSTGVAIDSGAANVYIVGTTNSTDIASSVTSLVTSASYQPCLNNLFTVSGGVTTCNTSQTNAPTDAFVARLSNPTNAPGTTTPVNISLNYFSYLGGAQNDAGQAIAVDAASGALLTGFTESPNTGAGVSGSFPVYPPSNPIQSQLNGPKDAFVARINTAAVVGQTTQASWVSYFGGSGTDLGTGIALDVNQNTYLAGETNSTDLQTAKPLQAGNKGGYDAFVAQFGTAVSVSIAGVLTLGNNQSFISAGNQATFTYTIANNGPDLASNLAITDNLGTNVTGIPLSFVSASTSSGTCGGISTSAVVSCSLSSLQAGATATVTIVVTPTANSSGTAPESFNGGSVQVTGPGNIVLAQTSVPASMSDFAMNVSPTNQNVPRAGDTVTYNVQLTPHPLYGSAITLSCSNLPAATTCAFSPNNSITLQSSSGATVTLAITTTARPIPTPAASLFTRHFYAVWLGLPAMTLLGLGIGGDRRRRRILGISMLCWILFLLILLPACSHTTTQAPAGGTPAGSYSPLITASSGSDSKTQSIGLNVP